MLIALMFQILAPIFPADTIRVGIVGDSQLNAFNTYDAICRDMRAQGISLWVGLGDHVQDHGLPGEWQRLFDGPMAPLAGVPRLGALGNHDDILGYTQHVWQIPQHPLASIYGNAIGCWGAVTWGPVRWVFLDTNEDPTIRLSLAPQQRQGTWLQAELASLDWQQARWRIAVWHHPVAVEFWDGGCFYPALPERRWLFDSLALAGCHLALNGHSHAYHRGDWRGTRWIISGGGGGWLDTTHCQDLPEITVATVQWHWLLMQVTPDALTIQARNTQGQVIDTVRIP